MRNGAVRETVSAPEPITSASRYAPGGSPPKSSAPVSGPPPGPSAACAGCVATIDRPCWSSTRTNHATVPLLSRYTSQ